MAREMKDSGIEWIGEIPSEWKTVKFKYTHIGSNVGEAIDKIFWSTDENDRLFYTAQIQPIRTSYKDFPKEKYTTQNDILLARNATPYVYLPVSGAVYTDHIIRTTIRKEFDKKFVRYCLQNSIKSIIVEGVSIPTWSISIWNNQTIPCPVQSKQQGIADFLDTQCVHIDSVIEKTRAAIEEYKKLKQSVITQAVTKGVRPNREMKDSGIEWIGEIPEEWKIGKAKHYVSITNGSDPKYDGDIPVYGSGANSFKTCGEYKEGPCVLIGRKGATLHIPHYIDHNYWNVDTAFDVKPLKSYNLRYYYYTACCFDYKLYISQTTLPGMTQTNYENMFVPTPNLSEQTEIVAYLDEKTAAIDSLIQKKEQLISELEAYKKSLIYEYVTGKKEVPVHAR